MWMRGTARGLAGAVLGILMLLPGASRAAEDDGRGYTAEEIVAAATGFFGETSAGIAEVVEKVFADHGRPDAYITGEEVGGAVTVGLRYGKGTLSWKGHGDRPIFWQGPSVGFDFGGNAAKSFILVYNMDQADDLFRRFPGGEGMIYFVAGVGVTYQQAGDTILAPIRTGVGLRTGANVGYVHYTREHSWIPF